MTAISIALLASFVWPLPLERKPAPPIEVRARPNSWSPRQEALYNRLWTGPIQIHEPIDYDAEIPADALIAPLPNAPRDRQYQHLTANDFSTAADDWLRLGFRDDDIRRKMGRQFDLELAKLKSNLVLVDPNANPDVPLRRTGWRTEELLHMPLAGSLFVIGQLQANSGSVEWQQYQFIGRTGLGMRLPAWLGGELQLRGGRSLANYDPDDESMFPGRTKTFFELATKWPLLGRINLEYTGKAVPGQLPHERDVLKQEVKLAIPFSDSGQFHIGARYHSEDTLTPSPWQERTNMFIGLQMKR